MLNGLKQKFICAVLKNSVPTSQKQSRLYKDQSVNAVYVHNHCFVGFVLITYIHSVGKFRKLWMYIYLPNHHRGITGLGVTRARFSAFKCLVVLCGG